ncbi:hypothetical protein IWQ56_001583 [Coemansia nantahalensis]|uniref:Uncharacterized protein n=1 Tax=Coemansia nantahalensis TaxID=2789366 RepID=A0ACC1JWP6_9FUNG|nr:hypothetical protein IWQ57_003449 [Coemansia nantahalensis]KAJ2771952.1 hypothetical protein IWQ56_001583 [Coemansia nantahalensis]
MSQYPNAYHSHQKYGGASPQRSQPFIPMAYAAIGGMPGMGGMVQQPAPHSVQPYAFMQAAAAAAAPGVPQYTQTQQPLPLMGPAPTVSSRVALEPSCVVYLYDAGATMPRPHDAQQVVLADGKVYIEHVPGHNVVFVPSNMGPAAAVAQHVAGSRVTKGRARGATLSKPSNVFFKYRSVKQRELQEAHPRLNQTVISQMVAEHWRAEPPEVKDKFRSIYREEMRKYEQSKRVRRPRAEFGYADAEDAALEAQAPRRSSDPQVLVHEPVELGINPGALASIAPRHRSFTMPADTAQQLGISRLID